MGSAETGASPDRAFWLLGDETRMAIINGVWESPDDTVSFTELRARVGNPDSGQFNYHINKLTGHYLGKTDEGYSLTQAGREVIRAVLAGIFTEQPATSPSRIDAGCVECGSALIARFDEYGIVECPDCGSTVMWNEFPPAGLTGRTTEAFARAFDRWVQTRFTLAMDGICPNCASQMTAEIHESGDGDDDELYTQHRCQSCKYEARIPVFGHAIRHPAVISFYHEAGVDVTRMPYWELQRLARGFTQEVLDRDPWAARLTIEADGRQIRLALDEQCDITVIPSSV